jgi:hypothetical protein
MKLSITLVVSIIINRFTVKYLKNYVVYKIVPKNGGITLIACVDWNRLFRWPQSDKT